MLETAINKEVEGLVKLRLFPPFFDNLAHCLLVGEPQFDVWIHAEHLAGLVIDMCSS